MKPKLNIKVLLLLTSVLLITSCIEEVEVPANTYRTNFETLWYIIDTRYCYHDYKDTRWDSVYNVFEERLATDTINEISFFDAMGEMLSELKDGHVNLYSSFDRTRYWKWFTDFPANFSSSLIYNERYLGSNYRVVNGLRYQKIANDEIGYLYYSSFSDNFSDQNIRYIFQYFMDCKGLIIDVRNNGGGSAELSAKLASYFFQRDTVSVYMRHKTGPGHSDFSEPIAMPTKAHENIQWQRPVVVLANRSSYSATNLFISRMKDAPRGIIVGDRSGGGGGLPLSNELPNGWMVRFSASPMFDGAMNDIESGIDPHVRVELDSVMAANGYDSIIEYAIQHLSQQ